MKKSEEPYRSIIDGSVYDENKHKQDEEYTPSLREIEDILRESNRQETQTSRKTKLCKKCKMDIPKGATVCPHCKSKQGMGAGGCLLVIILVVIAICIIKPMSEGYQSAQNGENGSTVQPAVSPQEYMAQCSTISFDELSRNPDKYKGQKFTFTGQVVQVMEPSYGETVALRINVTKGEYLWSDTIYAEVDIPKENDRILEDDIITIYGECDGLYSYESVVGKKISLPKIDIAYFTVN